MQSAKIGDKDSKEVNAQIKEGQVSSLRVEIECQRIAAWIVEFSGEEFQKIEKYCEDNDEDIEYFFGGPNEEELVIDVLEADWDMYGASGLASDFQPDHYCPVFNASDEEIVIRVFYNDDLVIDDLSKINIDMKKMSIEDWEQKHGQNDAIAYAFGYISDENHISTYKMDCKGEFDIRHFTLNIIDNEFFGYEYINGVTYKNNGTIFVSEFEEHDEDFEGEYFNTYYYSVR